MSQHESRGRLATIAMPFESVVRPAREGAARLGEGRRRPVQAGGFCSVDQAVEAIGRGEMVVVVDDPARENEGDLVMAAEFVTAGAVDFMARFGRGLICVPMPRWRLDELEIPPMVARNTDQRGTAFHVSVDLREGTSTGISARDRALTIRALADRRSLSDEFTQPGHVFPLACRAGGVLERAGHTEASADLAAMAGAEPVAVICEIASTDGDMMRLPELREFAKRHGLLVLSIEDLVAYRRGEQRVVSRVSEARLPLGQAEFTAVGYRDVNGREHMVAVLGDVDHRPGVLVRVHSECLTGDVFGSQRCDCGRQLELALEMIAAEGAGVVVYLRGQEGRGIGLLEKLNAYQLQDTGLDTVDANVALGHPPDLREYVIGAQILRDLGVDAIRLLTNNPAKRTGLEDAGLTVADCVPLRTVPTEENVAYLAAKRTRMGHLLENESATPLRGRAS
jgi:3,4-dihydroxy 2-butanone 4-phosphate synthase / GTP cyclohydrolase II